MTCYEVQVGFIIKNVIQYLWWILRGVLNA